MKNVSMGKAKKWPYWSRNTHFRTGYEHFHFEADFVDEFPVAYEYGRLLAASGHKFTADGFGQAVRAGVFC